VTSPVLPHEPLSAAQQRVLAQLNRGLTTREIAQQLDIAVGTVRWHLNHIFGKLRVRNRTQAVVKAVPALARVAGPYHLLGDETEVGR